MDYIKQRVVEDSAGRKELYARLKFSLQGIPDPWAERAAGAERREYEAIEA
jgi:nitrite reductase (NADH) large subunit